MYVQSIEIKNLKTIKEFSTEFSGGIYLVTGENEIGKSTLLEAIVTLLTGERTGNLLSRNEEKGYIKATIGEGETGYDVELRFSKANPRGTLTISQKGTLMKSDRLTALQDIFKYQDFDANEFVLWSETAEGRRKQVDAVKSFLSEEVKKRIDEIEDTIKVIKSENTTINAEIKVYETRCKESGVTPDMLDKYATPIVLEKLIEEKTTAAAHNEKVKGVQERYNERKKTIEEHPVNLVKKQAEFDTEIVSKDAEIEKLRKEYERKIAAVEKEKKDLEKQKKQLAADAKTELDDLLKLQNDSSKWLIENPIIVLEEIQGKITKANEHNANHEKVKVWKESSQKLKAAAVKKENNSNSILKLLSEKDTLIKESKLPIDGLSFDEEGLTLNGIPFRKDDISTSQEMEVAAKLIIAKNPHVKVFRIAQGESLGEKRFKAIVDFAKSQGYQGFIEEVRRGQNELKVEEYTESERE